MILNLMGLKGIQDLDHGKCNNIISQPQTEKHILKGISRWKPN